MIGRSAPPLDSTVVASLKKSFAPGGARHGLLGDCCGLVVRCPAHIAEVRAIRERTTLGLEDPNERRDDGCRRPSISDDEKTWPPQRGRAEDLVLAGSARGLFLKLVSRRSSKKNFLARCRCRCCYLQSWPCTVWICTSRETVEGRAPHGGGGAHQQV